MAGLPSSTCTSSPTPSASPSASAPTSAPAPASAVSTSAAANNTNPSTSNHPSRFDHPHASLPRPHLSSQHSNSVPSTPYQKPRDLGRFHSRSPSPNQGITNQSPRSVVSEAVGARAANPTQPLVCKYETGSEIRKRRIPYVDGGNEELGPPKKEPKKTLQPDEEKKLSADMRELYNRLLPSDESEERRTKLVKKLNRILNDRWPGNGIRVNVFGSSGNLLSSTDSDVDICVTTPPSKSLESMHSLAQTLAGHGMEKVICRAAAKVPIVKCWDPELKLAADLNVNNTLALQNTRMIKTYVQLDHRVRPLAKIIKYWTKRRLLNDAAYGGTISSYTWICMIISFLQRRNPPILPSLQKITECRLRTESGELSPFADDIDGLRLKGYGRSNKESLGELLFQFFRHYGYEFEYSKYVVSVREGRLLSRKEKGWDPKVNHQDKESRNRLCVEEPFTANRNLGNSADDYAWHGIHSEIRRAFDLLEDGLQLEKCCEQFEFPPEESRPIFQRPPPKPKPTLTRSASQSNRPEAGSGRSTKRNNRNQSAQRTGNRRASSGATYSNHRLPFSPPLVGNPGDYFQVKGNLHEQLFQQYQYLQAQQDALRHQLERQQQQAVASARAGDLASGGSPRPRQHVNGLPSPRYMETPPQTAPLLPGYMYHYPAQPRYPPASPMSQARSQQGTNTNPSSPSLIPALPSLRRGGNRTAVPEGLAGSTRSQSQPGRSLPHPLSLQQHIHPGYEMSTALAGSQQYQALRPTSQMHPQHPGAQLPLSAQLPGFQHAGQNLESATPKEYVGYYVGQSPQLGPQQFAPSAPLPPPPMNLRDPPARQRRVTPDLLPPMLNGAHHSRSPSPLGGSRCSTDLDDPQHLFNPVRSEHHEPSPSQLNGHTSGPVIVNGSNRSAAPKLTERVNGASGLGLQLHPESMPGLEDPVRARPLPIRTNLDTSSAERRVDGGKSTAEAPLKSIHDDETGVVANGTHTNGTSDPLREVVNASMAPMLSPVAELRTPSPTQNRPFEHESTGVNGLLKAAKIATAKQVVAENGTSKMDQPPDHGRLSSVPIASASGKPAAPTKIANEKARNEWQTASGGRNKHKKNKSSAGTKSPHGLGGQYLQASDMERKGG